MEVLTPRIIGLRIKADSISAFIRFIGGCNSLGFGMTRIAALSILTCALISAVPAAGQTTQNSPGNAAQDDARSTAPPGRFSRWLDLQAGVLGARYKVAAASEAPAIYQIQYQFQARGRLTFDRRGRYYAGFRLSTGKVFSYSWNSTGAGDGDFAANVYLKELYLSASPLESIEIQFGGIGFNRGASTEITSYSNNGYLVGERITVRRPDRLFFDEISAAGAYLGDQAKPGVFERISRLDRMNYHQFLVSRKISERVTFSLDYTSQDGVETLRQAVRVQPDRNRYVDSAVFENYQRLDFRPAWGFGVTLQKNPTQRLALTGGFVDIDKDFAVWNADKLGKGKRIFVTAAFNFWREFSVVVFAGKAFAGDFPVINAARFDCVVSYDFMKALKRAGVL